MVFCRGVKGPVERAREHVLAQRFFVGARVGAATGTVDGVRLRSLASSPENKALLPMV